MIQWVLFEVPATPITVVVRSRRRFRKPAAQIPFYLWMSERAAVEYISGQPFDALPFRVADEIGLALAIQRGGPEGAEAFDELMRRCERKLCTAAKRHACSWWPREDVVVDLQSKLYRVCRHYNYRPGASLLSLADRAIANYAISEIRNKVRKRVDNIDHLSDAAATRIVDTSEGGFEEVELRRDLETLSDDARLLAIAILETGEFPKRKVMAWGAERISLAKSELAAWLSHRRGGCDTEEGGFQVQQKLFG